MTSSPIASQSRGTGGGKSGRAGRLMRTGRRVLTRRPKLRPRGAIVQPVGGRNISYALCDVTALGNVASCSEGLTSSILLSGACLGGRQPCKGALPAWRGPHNTSD